MHPLEQLLNAPGADILDAIMMGFRAQADVKGKLAELYCNKILLTLKNDKIIEALDWHDKDGVPDFEIVVRGRKRIIECKNVRSGKTMGGADYAKVELQKTRSGSDRSGKKTRGYATDHFDILSACLFNQTGQWDFRFILATKLLPRPANPLLLTVMQTVWFEEGKGGWTSDIRKILI